MKQYYVLFLFLFYRNSAVFNGCWWPVKTLGLTTSGSSWKDFCNSGHASEKRHPLVLSKQVFLKISGLFSRSWKPQDSLKEGSTLVDESTEQDEYSEFLFEIHRFFFSVTVIESDISMNVSLIYHIFVAYVYSLVKETTSSFFWNADITDVCLCPLCKVHTVHRPYCPKKRFLLYFRGFRICC